MGKIKLSTNECFKLFDHSFNRIKYFSCIMDNLSVTTLPDDWKIKKESSFDYAIQKPDDKQKEKLVDGCRHFMQCYLVRDCIESFALCLDRLFLVLLLHGKRILPNQTLYNSLSKEDKKSLKTFEKVGLSGKVQQLKNIFKLELPEEHNRIIVDLKDIRNCLAHSNGIVRDRDGKENGKEYRKFHWATFSVFAVGIKSGKEFKIELNKPFGEEANICAKLNIKDNFKSFKIGEMLSFSSSETYDIAWSLQLVAGKYLEELNTMILSKENKY